MSGFNLTDGQRGLMRLFGYTSPEQLAPLARVGVGSVDDLLAYRLPSGKTIREATWDEIETAMVTMQAERVMVDARIESLGR